MGDDIENGDSGARFVRGDLHIHSYGGSYDVKDERATPSAIVEKARERGIQVIALSDHNSIDNVQAFLAAADAYDDVVAIPAVELSCQEGHLLAYAPTWAALQQLFGRLDISRDSRSGETSCNTGMHQVLQHVAEAGGFALLAHVDVATGFEQRVPGWTPQKKAILCHGALLGCEVRAWPSPFTYDEDDEDEERKAVGRERIEKLGQPPSLYRFARVVNSDAHDLDRVGANDAGRDRTTRYKMSTPTFEALKIALLDPGARVRVEDGLRGAIPRLVGMRLTGGFLDGSMVRFSPNLTCVIGGRGTGKTTTIKCAESVAHLDEKFDWNDSLSVLESDVGPDELELVVRDAFGSTFTVRKAKGDCAYAVDGDGNPVDLGFRVDVFRQSEASDLAPRVRQDPGALLEYLDGHIPGVRELHSKDADLRTRLVDAQAASREAHEKTEECAERLKGSRGAAAQVKQAKQAKVGALAKLERERSGFRQAGTRVAALKAALLDVLGERPLEPVLEDYPDLLGVAAPGSEDAAQAEGDGAPAPVLEDVGDTIRALDGELTQWLRERIDPLLKQIAEKATDLKDAEGVSSREADDKKAELRAKDIVFDLNKLRVLAAQEAKVPQHELALAGAKKKYSAALQQEVTLLKERRQLHSALETARTAWATRILREVPKTDLRISLKFQPDRYSPEAKQLVISEMGWRTNQQKKAHALLGDLGFWGLTDVLRKAGNGKEKEAIEAVKSVANGALFNNQDAKELVTRLSRRAVMRKLATCRVDCLPVLKVGRMSSQKSREYSRLSIGQQQSVLLTLLLADDHANNPLLLDQPEDNLDSEFIFKAIVPALRRAKERRQVVIVTHNANVCVLGDAEQIVVLKSAQDKGKIVGTGAIDRESLKRKVCEVLEGTEEAFRLRGQMYGVRVG